MQFAVYISDRPMTLKQSQSHQIQNDNVDPEEGYNHAKFERSSFNNVQERDLSLYSNDGMCQLSPLNMCAHPKKVIHFLST